MVTRRCCKRVVVFATLGIATAVLIAWVRAMFPFGPMNFSSYSYRFELYGATGYCYDTATVTNVFVGDFASLEVEHSQRHWQGWIVGPAVKSVERACLAESPSPPWRYSTVQAFGWPLRCMWYRVGEPDLSKLVVMKAPDDPAIQLGTSVSQGVVVPRLLPLRPLWLGLAGNTVVFGGVWWMLFSIPALIRRRRRKRGHCEQCNYDLQGLTGKVCPECGRET